MNRQVFDFQLLQCQYFPAYLSISGRNVMNNSSLFYDISKFNSENGQQIYG